MSNPSNAAITRPAQEPMVLALPARETNWSGLHGRGIWPGLALAAVAAATAYAVRQLPVMTTFSPMILAIVIGIVAVGLTTLMATMGYWFDWVRFAGAAYLVWLGIKLIRFPVMGVKADEPPPPPLASAIHPVH